jgi:ADP-ribosylglycohydrolase
MPYDSRDTLNDLFATGLIDLQRGALFDTVPRLHDAAVWPRVEGLLLGLAIGDALGNTSESLRPGERQLYHREVRDYLPNAYVDGRAVGLPSDDTQLAFWTLEQLLADDGLDPGNLARRFASQPIFGLGSTVREFLLNHRDGLPWRRCGPKSPGSGALMRIAPMFVAYLGAPAYPEQ